MPTIPIDQVLQKAIKERERAKLTDSPGEMYRDAGRHNRAHDACVPPF
jgi:hypothetical protein